MINNDIPHYRSYNVAEDAKCPVCLDSMKNADADAVAHDGFGKLHALHRACAKTWATVSDKCPTCRVSIDKNSLASWSDRISIWKDKMPLITKPSRADSIRGAAIGTIVGGLQTAGITAIAFAIIEKEMATLGESGAAEILTRTMEAALKGARLGLIIGAPIGTLVGGVIGLSMRDVRTNLAIFKML